VGELPLDVQVTLLRFLESGEYLRLGETQVRRADVRIIAATNRELRTSEGEKLFRRDLLFRLNEIEIRLPALRERSEDILPLARHFLTFYGGLDGAAADARRRSGPAVLSVARQRARAGERDEARRGAPLRRETLDAEALLPFLDPARESARRSRRRNERERAEILARSTRSTATAAGWPKCSASAARRSTRGSSGSTSSCPEFTRGLEPRGIRGASSFGESPVVTPSVTMR
jgi:hypothetical protein